MAESSACACSMVTPGLRNAKPSTPPRAAILQLVSATLEVVFHRGRNPKLEPVADECSEEPFGHHADDGVLHAIQPLSPADDRRIGLVTILPRLIADHRDRMGVVPRVLARFECAAEDRADPQGVEIIGRNHAARGTLRAVANAERGAPDVFRDEGIDQRGVSPEILEVRPGNVGPAVAVDARQGDHPVLAGHKGERVQQDSLDPTAHGGDRSDAQGQAEDREKREPRVAPEHAKAVPYILPQGLNHGNPRFHDRSL